MADKTLGALIKEARTGASLTQEKLAQKAGGGLTAQDISKAERGTYVPTQDQLKRIAKATGVTQASLLNAAKAAETPKKPASSTAKKPASSTAAKKPASSTAAKKPASSTAAKKPASSTAAKKPAASKTPAGANSTMKVTATERKLVETYRAATAAQKKAATRLLKGEADDYLDNINSSGTGAVSNVVENILGNIFGSALGGKREMPEGEDQGE